MRRKVKGMGVAMTLLGAASLVAGGITNSVPWQDSFESYTNGTPIAGTNGWTGDQPDAGTVTTDPAVVDLLTNYPVSGRSYPLTGSHTNVLSLRAGVDNQIRSVTGGVVRVDFLVLPAQSELAPEGDTNKQYQFCVLTNGLLTIWHRNMTAGSNEWLTLASSPVISTGAWSRFTVYHDYSNQMYQVAVNESAPLTDAAGWTAGGAAANGSWFYMVQTNGVLTGLKADGTPVFLDDLAVARRSLGWSQASFSESVTNNGGVDTAVVITLTNDTFAGTVGDDLVASNKVTVTGLPSNLVAVARMDTATRLSVTLTGTALLHEAVDSTTLTLAFEDTAFTMGRVWDVTGNQTNVDLTFLDTPSLSYSTNHFYETTTNNGSIDNSSPLLITLVHGTFDGALDEDFAANASKLVVDVPDGLTAEAVMLSTTQLQFRLLGTAVQHDASNDTSSLSLSFQDGAFTTVPASSVFHSSTNLSVSFTDPGALEYGTTVFSETVTNNGMLAGTTLTLVNKSFNATNGEDLVLSGKVVVTNLPDGLGLQVVCGETAQSVTVIFTGGATSNVLADSISTLGLTFLDGAFVGGNASAVLNYSLLNLQIQFDDPRVLTYSGTSFVEISGGVIDNRNPVVITLSGDTFAGTNGEDFVAGDKIDVANVPLGLTAKITRSSSTQLSVTFTGLANPHSSDASRSDISFTLTDGAFTGGNAVFVGGYMNTGISITFGDEAEFFNVMPYEESFESYVAGALLSGTNGWTGLSATAGRVTNGAALIAGLEDYNGTGRSYPISSVTHTQVLAVGDTLSVKVHSEAATHVFVDFLTLPVAVREAPLDDTNQQWAFYVSTNQGLVVWQQTRGGGPSVNEWITLSNAPAIGTSEWIRVTIENDYANDMFQIRINQGRPIEDSRGWSAPGGSLGGPWFYMVQTNRTLTSLRMTGSGPAFLEDLTVKSALSAGFPYHGGAIYLFR